MVFDNLRSATSPSSSPYGIGGDANTIWHCDASADLIYELSTTDFSVVRSAASPSSSSSGIGGDANTIWHCDYNADLIYELDGYTNEVTYYFNSRSTGNWTDPDKMIDNILTNYASTTAEAIETLNANNCSGTNLGTFGHIYIRIHGYGDGNDRIDFHPVFGGITEGSEYQTTPGISAGWSEYICIEYDAQAPSPWTWSDVVALDGKIEKDTVSKSNVMYCAKVEIIVSYNPSAGGPRSQGYIF